MKNKKYAFILILLVILLFFILPVNKYYDEDFVQDASSPLLRLLIRRENLAQVEGLKLFTGSVFQQKPGETNEIAVEEKVIYRVNSEYLKTPIVIEESILIPSLRGYDLREFLVDEKEPLSRVEINSSPLLSATEVIECLKYESDYGECRSILTYGSNVVILRVIYLKQVSSEAISGLLLDLIEIAIKKIASSL